MPAPSQRRSVPPFGSSIPRNRHPEPGGSLDGHRRKGMASAGKLSADANRAIGLEVAVEALREGWRAKKFTLEQLAESARVCRVNRVIQPYLEMLT